MIKQVKVGEKRNEVKIMNVQEDHYVRLRDRYLILTGWVPGNVKGNGNENGNHYGCVIDT